MFDKSNFKIRSFDILPVVRDFFKQPTGERNITNIDEIRRYLSDIKPYSRLSMPLQNQILQEAWYECYAERRTIVRQGDHSGCFYVILSGSALITYKRITNAHTETLDILDRGCTFGEKGLMTNSRQLFTVTCKTQVELLVLWKDDFKAIYMADDRYCSQDDLKFLKTSVPFLRTFPIDRLNEFPHAIQYCNFGPSEVVARDSRHMKHIFVVKKGSLAIWKRLDPDGHIPKLSKHDFEQIQNDKMTDENDDEEDQEETADNKALFSEIQLRNYSSIRSTLESIRERDESKSINFNHVISKRTVSGDINASGAGQTTLDTDFHISRLRRSTTVDRRMSSSLSRRSDSIADIEKKFPGIFDKRDRLQMIDYDHLSINTTNNNPKLPLTNGLSTRSRSMTDKKSKLTLPDKMVYLHVKTLNEGQYFGLTDMLFPNQPSLTLISNECECLLLLKSSFVRIASDQYKQNIRRTEIPFPSDSVFYKSYHTNEVWKRYSKEVYKNVCEKMIQSHRRPTK